MNEKLMRESWARDDTAIQRRVADLKAAGLNPVLASGSGAANSGPIRINPVELSNVDLTRAFSAGIAGTQNQMIKSKAAQAASEASAAGAAAERSIAEDNYKKAVAENMIPRASMAAQSALDKQWYDTLTASMLAKTAIAEASIKEHDAEVLKKFPDLLSTSSSMMKDLMGGAGMLGSFLDKIGKYQFVPKGSN